MEFVKLALILLFLPLASAATYDPVIFNTTYAAGSTISLAEGDFYFDVGIGNVTSVILQRENETNIIGEGECARYGYELFCNEEKTEQGKARVSLKDLRAHVESEFEIDETEVDFGQEITGEWTLTNNGLKSAEQVITALSLENFTVVDTDYCKSNETHIYWKGNILPEDDITCTFTIIPDFASKRELQVKTDYYAYKDNVSLNSSTEELTVNEPFLINVTASKELDQLEPNEPFTITALFNNTNEDNITISRITFFFEKDLEIVSKSSPHMIKKGNSASMRIAKVEPEEVETAWIELSSPILNSSGEIKVEIQYSFEDEPENRTVTRSFYYQTHKQQLTIYTIPQELSFEAYEDVEINISIHNPYTFQTFKGYDVEVESPLLSEKVTQSVPYEQNRKLLTLRFTAPNVSKTLDYDIRVSVIARTDDFETVTVEQSFPITLTPIRGISIEQVVSHSNQSSTVEVYATNNHKNNISASFKEIIPSSVFIQGSINTQVELEPGKKVLVYRYDVKTTESGIFGFETDYSYSYLGTDFSGSNIQNVSFQQTGSLTPSIPQQNMNITVNQSIRTNASNTSATQNGASSNEETGFLQAYWVYILLGIIVLILGVMGKLLWPKFHKAKSTPQTADPVERYDQLLHDLQRIREERAAIKDREKQVKNTLKTLKEHLSGYESQLPQEITRLDKEKDHLMKLRNTSSQKQQELELAKQQLAQKEQEIDEYNKKLDLLSEQIRTREEALHKDEDTLKQDISTLEKELGMLKSQQEQKMQEQHSLAATLREHKKAHAHEIKKRIDELQEKRQVVQQQDQSMLDEMKRLEEEFKKAQEDLEASEVDVLAAEKIYKEAEATPNQKDE